MLQESLCLVMSHDFQVYHEPAFDYRREGKEHERGTGRVSKTDNNCAIVHSKPSVPRISKEEILVLQEFSLVVVKRLR